VAAVAGGESVHAVATRMNLAYQTVRRWFAEDGPVHGPNARTREELGDIVYDSVVDTLNAIRARAIETSKPEWISNQSASAIADLDRIQWEQIVRVIASFRPVDGIEDDEGLAIHEHDPHWTRPPRPED
jgi:hypothetical protein